MRFRSIASHASFLLWSVTLIGQTGIPVEQQTSKTPMTIHQLFAEDQQDLQAGTDGKPRFTEEEYHQRVETREAMLRAMLAAGEIKTGDDFRDAAFIFQHGDSADDCMFAHILAMEAMARGTESARFIAAATLDRYLQAIKQPQVFGTQYSLDSSASQPAHVDATSMRPTRTLDPYNESFLPDSVKSDFCVPNLAQQKQNVAIFNAGGSPQGTMHPPCH